MWTLKNVKNRCCSSHLNFRGIGRIDWGGFCSVDLFGDPSLQETCPGSCPLKIKEFDFVKMWEVSRTGILKERVASHTWWIRSPTQTEMTCVNPKWHANSPQRARCFYRKVFVWFYPGSNVFLWTEFRNQLFLLFLFYQNARRVSVRSFPVQSQEIRSLPFSFHASDTKLKLQL